MSPPVPSVSVVLPAYNEGERLPGFIGGLTAQGLTPDFLPVEFLIVDDGSAPAHLECTRAAVEAAAERLGASQHQIRLIALPTNCGKGAAIRHGWSHADPRAEWLGFLDADGSVPARELWRFVAMLARGDFDLLAGSRIRMAGHQIRRRLLRHVQGRVFATLSEQLLFHGFYDTQCGLKLVRASLLRPWLENLREERWLLDLEIIALLQREGARCLEVPIDWADLGGSKVVPGIDPLRMLLGLRRLRRRLAAQPGYHWRSRPSCSR